MEVKHNDYQIIFDAEHAAVRCSGSFRLRSSEYEPIIKVLNAAADADLPTLTLDLRELRFLNSSGINTLAKFVVRLRVRDKSQTTVLGSRRFPWQRKSLRNFQRLLPSLAVELKA